MDSWASPGPTIQGRKAAAMEGLRAPRFLAWERKPQVPCVLMGLKPHLVGNALSNCAPGLGVWAMRQAHCVVLSLETFPLFRDGLAVCLLIQASAGSFLIERKPKGEMIRYLNLT